MAKKLSVPDSFIAQACDVFKLLSDKTRLGIVLHLMEEPHSVGDLCVKLDLPQPTVSHHLALMRMSRLLLKRRRGKQMIYSLNVDLLRDLAENTFKYMSPSGKTIQAGPYTFSKKK